MRLKGQGYRGLYRRTDREKVRERERKKERVREKDREGYRGIHRLRLMEIESERRHRGMYKISER